MPKESTHNRSGKEMIRASFHQPKAFGDTFNEAASLLGTGTNDNETLKKALEFVVVHKGALEPEARISRPLRELYGLQEIIQIADSNERFTATVLNAKTLRLFGVLFGWMLSDLAIPQTINARIGEGLSTEIITPVPGQTHYQTNEEREIFLREFFAEALKSRPSPNKWLRTFGMLRPMPYAGIQTETELWIRHDLGGLTIHPFFWIYTKTLQDGDFYQWIDNDLLTIRRQRHIDLIRHFGPKSSAKRGVDKKKGL